MLIDQLTLNPKEKKPQLYLCKPDTNKTIIASLWEAYDIKLTLKLGNINELNFTLPYEIEKNNTTIANPNISLVKDRFLIKLVFDTYIEYFTIRTPSDSMTEENDYKEITCYSLGYELTDKNITKYEVTSYTAQEALIGNTPLAEGEEVKKGVLQSTLWTVDYIDSSFINMKRSIEISSTTVLDAVFKVAETFGALILWNTATRKISLYKPENIGLNRGLKIEYGKYLKNLTKELDADNFCTRLKVRGKNEISIRSENPTGSDYLENYSYFMYPFQRDEAKNVLSHSDYMSDALCHALLDYQAKLKTREPEEKVAQTGTNATTLIIASSGLAVGDYIFNSTRDALRVVKAVSGSSITVETVENQASGDKIYLYKPGSFGRLLYEKHDLEGVRTTKKNELDVLNTDMTLIQDDIDVALSINSLWANDIAYIVGSFVIYNSNVYKCIVANTNKFPTDSTYWENYTDKKTNQQTLIDAKQAEIDAIDANIATINAQIEVIRADVDITKILTKPLLDELNPFIVEKEADNQYISDPRELIKWAEKEFEKLKTPLLVIDLNIIDLYKCLDDECVYDRDKLVLGEIITIKYERMNINLTAKINEINIDFSTEDGINVKLSNLEEILSDEEKFLKMINNVTGTSNQVTLEKYKWDDTATRFDEIAQLLDGAWDATKNEIVAGVNESVNISGRGIIVQDPSDPLKWLILQHGVIALTNDGGNTWKHAITSQGIIGERIVGEIMMGRNLIMTHDSGKFTFDENGVTILGTALTIEGGLPDSELASADKWNNGLSNPFFELDKQLWSSSYVGQNVPELTSGTIVSGVGTSGGKVLQIPSTLYVCYQNAFPVNTNRVYKVRTRVRLTKESTGQNDHIYAGLIGLDINYNLLSEINCSVNGNFIWSALGWAEYEGIITGVGNKSSNFTTGVVYVRPYCTFRSTTGATDGILQIDSLEFIDITDAYQAQQSASGKNKTFITPYTINSVQYSTPQPPYNVGDLWIDSINDATGVFRKCVSAKTSGSYLATDWVLAISQVIDKTAPTVGTLNNPIANSNGSITVSWSGFTDTDSGIAGYNIWRSNASDGSNKALLGSVASSTVTNFTDTTAVNQVTYYYAVSAYDKQGNESALTPFKSCKSNKTDAPFIPSNVTANAKLGCIVLNWDIGSSNNSVAYYIISKSTNGGTSYAFLANASSNTYTEYNISDTISNLANYRYTVKAVDYQGVQGANSSATTVNTTLYKPADNSAPNAPTGMTLISDNDGRITVYWNSSSSTDVARYRIYRSEDGGSTYVPIGESTTIQYIDSYLKHGQVYYYKVSAVDNTGMESSNFTTPNYATATDTTAPTPPNPTAIADSGAIKVIWTEVAELGCAYQIWRCNGATWADASATKIATVAGSISGGQGYFIDYDPPSDTATTYVYKLKVTDKWGNVSGFSVSSSSATSLVVSSADQLARDIAGGKMLFADATFKAGVNNCAVYNNAGNGVVVINRVTKATDCPTNSTHMLEITVTGTPSPGWGGYVQTIQSRANARFIVKLIAKIPVGYTLNLASNSMGTGYTDKLLTSNQGTGTWQEYYREIRCGASGTFSTGGHFYLTGGTTPTPTTPLVWQVAFATCYDVTDVSSGVQQDTQYNKIQISSANGIQVLNGSDVEVVKLGGLGTDYGIKATHADGTYTQLTQNGLERYVAGTSKTYKYLVYAGYGETISKTNWSYSGGINYLDCTLPAPDNVIVQLPDDFKNKNFTFTLSFTETTGFTGGHWGSKIVLREVSRDVPNARVTVQAYVYFDVMEKLYRHENYTTNGHTHAHWYRMWDFDGWYEDHPTFVESNSGRTLCVQYDRNYDMYQGCKFAYVAIA